MTFQVDFPFRVGPRGRTGTTGYAEHVRDMVEQLLFTTPGERVNRPELGCLLADMVFETNGTEQAAAVQSSAMGALERWLGDVILVDSLTATPIDSTLRVVVSYRLLATGEERTDTLVRETP
jgi:phage baseplate assembly protein W